MSRVPLQYLTGSAHWRDLVLAVGPGVLIPRPETELLIDFAKQVDCTATSV
jgi:release factor glutamine methyltransferase